MTPSVYQRLLVKEWFDASGLSVTDWAAAHGFKREQVYAFLNGKTSGRRGAAHEIAVALMLKEPAKPLEVHLASALLQASAADTQHMRGVAMHPT